MKIGKNQKMVDVCLNKQLCLLLCDFQWSHFSYKTRRPVERMS